MYRQENLRERLTVVGTPNFMEFASELEKEGVEIKEIDVGKGVINDFYISSEILEDQKQLNKFDIEFPFIVENIFRNEELLKTVDPGKFKFTPIEYKKLDINSIYLEAVKTRGYFLTNKYSKNRKFISSKKAALKIIREI